MDSLSPSSSPFLTVKETARILRVSEMTIRRAIADDQLPCVRIRGRFLVPRAFVDDLIKNAEAGMSVIVEDYAADWASHARRA